MARGQTLEFRNFLRLHSTLPPLHCSTISLSSILSHAGHLQAYLALKYIFFGVKRTTRTSNTTVGSNNKHITGHCAFSSFLFFL